MKKYLFNAFFLINSFFVLSQKEVYFNTAKPEDIKVESFSGFETRVSLNPNGFMTGFAFSFPTYYEPALYIGYYNEKRIADSWTLKGTIGLQNVASKRLIWVKDSINGNLFANTSNYTVGYELLLDLGIEPRWYWDYKNKYQLGEARLNSGWFLSFPICFQTTLLHSPEPIYNLGWLPIWFYGYASIIPTLGYRQVISKHWFLEGSFGLGTNFIFNINTWTHKFEITNPFLTPQLSIKAAYTFK